jgi:hypothetical protein
VTAFIRQALPAWIAGAAFGGMIGFLLVLKPEDIRPSMAAACDKAVGALLAARDMVELERAKYLVKEMDCSVRKRLRAGEAPP